VLRFRISARKLSTMLSIGHWQTDVYSHCFVTIALLICGNFRTCSVFAWTTVTINACACFIRLKAISQDGAFHFPDDWQSLTVILLIFPVKIIIDCIKCIYRAYFSRRDPSALARCSNRTPTVVEGTIVRR